MTEIRIRGRGGRGVDARKLFLAAAEAVFNAATRGSPFATTPGDRAIGAPLDFCNDRSDAMSLR